MPTPRPIPGHEVFGFVPYWEMNGDIAEHVAKTDLTTLALFSVTHTKTGTIDTSQTGYKRITGAIGEAADPRGARPRGRRPARLHQLRDGPQRALLRLAEGPGRDHRGPRRAGRSRSASDGINVDVEQLGDELVPAYGAFVGRLRDGAPGERSPTRRSRSATTAGPTGAAMALAAAAAGADRIFLMGYDYHYAGSELGASAPMDRRDGAEPDLPWSLDLYEAVGVPVEKTILGPAAVRDALARSRARRSARRASATARSGSRPTTRSSSPIHPRRRSSTRSRSSSSTRSPPTVSPIPGDSRATAGWQAIYVDSPETLAPKLALADDRGLAGAGFWAIGYERGLAGYGDLIARFAAGKLEVSVAGSRLPDAHL